MADDPSNRPKAAGLKWRTRRNSAPVPYWFASAAAVEAGYPVKSANLSNFAGDSTRLVAQSMRLQGEMLRWLSDKNPRERIYDGSFNPVFDLYETDPESTFQALPAETRRVYLIYLKRLRLHIGDCVMDVVDGRDVKRWFADWRGLPAEDRLPRARMVLAVLKAAMAFAAVCRVPGAAEFQGILRGLEFELPSSRTFAPTFEQVTAARHAAHAAGAHERALVYSLQYETTLRQWDIIGMWLPLSDPRPSAVIDRGQKWIGLDWKMLQESLILARVKPSKTAKTTGVDVSFDLAVCEMVMEDMAYFPPATRTGPMIVDPRTGLPYRSKAFCERGWKKDFAAAGLPDGIWNRDLRAGGVTEGRKAGASKDDIRKLAGHANERTTDTYDRDDIEAHRRTSQARKNFRRQNKA